MARSVLTLDRWRDSGPYAQRAERIREWILRREPNRRIDTVFAGLPQRSGPGQLRSCRAVCNDGKGCVWPTDHWGVYAELRTDRLPDA